ncbi:MAG: UDP-3-O-(3-hydroxymyristoyl)glucosamine N-acyltransferase [Candidatus Omnitrophica bacterium]|nr:UDP-3-O-(3-hydroxymyristoyl)glucosamine N-acyltransferase [Candidatus Omnitrophota bacterium]MDD5552603.1 UDP-3-O-(3-hydroxymyristoyl)glucosamine N-acyltransferase [Candidatus Omnitrophota bacterium]
MQKTLKEIAGIIDGEISGNPDIIITGISGIREAREGDITFLANPKYLPLLEKTGASAVITSREVKEAPKPIIRTDNPSFAFAKLISFISPAESRRPQGIHPSAILGKDVSLGRSVAIGPYAVIEDSVSIGDGCVIYSGCFVGHHSKIGGDCVIYPNVSIREQVTIGSRVIIHSGTVIGSDGFGFATIEGLHHKIPQVGTVEIGDDVEIGANVTIDRARFDKTVIGSGTKIDNLVQIAHNVSIGNNSIIVAQVGISGSTTVGNNVILAGQAGLVGHISVGDNSIVMAQSGVSKSIPPDTMVWGYPAKPAKQAKRANACVQNLPRLYETVSELKKKIEELEAKLK